MLRNCYAAVKPMLRGDGTEYPSLAPGDVIMITQEGGIIDEVKYEDSSDPLLQVDDRYLFFLWEARPGNWVGTPFGRFRVSEGDKLNPDSASWAICLLLENSRD